MTKLSDTQRVLLASAAQREDGSVLPLPATITAGGGTSKALAALLTRGLAYERETGDPAATRRREGDLAYGLFITAAGMAAIGVEVTAPAEPVSAAEPAPIVSATKPKRVTKADAVLVLLQRDEGATLPELIAATGWLPHTTRAALTGLRKKGHDVTRAKRDGVTCYCVTGQAA